MNNLQLQWDINAAPWFYIESSKPSPEKESGETEKSSSETNVSLKNESEISTPQKVRLKVERFIQKSENPPFVAVTDSFSDPIDLAKHIHSILKIESHPRLQAVNKVFSASDENVDSRHQLSFVEQTKGQIRENINALQRLNIPLNSPALEKIYFLLSQHINLLCRNDRVKYPALYKVTQNELHEMREDTLANLEGISFDLEIHSDKKASLIFYRMEKLFKESGHSTFIGKGLSKNVWKVFSLEKPEVKAYSISKYNPNVISTVENEERCIALFKDCGWAAKVYNVFYYQVALAYTQQIIEMKYYPRELFEIIEEPLKYPLSNEIKWQYSIQIMQAVVDVKHKGFVHRDIKLENFLIDEDENEKLVLIDFGFSIPISDCPNSKTAGSVTYLAPEGIQSSKDNYGPGLDVWAAGCTLWLIWFGPTYPWYTKVDADHLDSKKIPDILNSMRNFDNTKIDPNKDLKHKIYFFLWNMLRFKVNDRWTAEQALEQLKALA